MNTPRGRPEAQRFDLQMLIPGREPSMGQILLDGLNKGKPTGFISPSGACTWRLALMLTFPTFLYVAPAAPPFFFF